MGFTPGFEALRLPAQSRENPDGALQEVKSLRLPAQSRENPDGALQEVKSLHLGAQIQAPVDYPKL
jgi:hypothetical protein